MKLFSVGRKLAYRLSGFREQKTKMTVLNDEIFVKEQSKQLIVVKTDLKPISTQKTFHQKLYEPMQRLRHFTDPIK